MSLAFAGKGAAILEHRFSCLVIHSDRSQQERQRNLEKFRDGEVRFLITTDVAARGIDIKEIPYIISAFLFVPS